MNNSDNKVDFHPVISSIQKVALYETKSKLLLVGSNDCETRFRVLEIDRTHPFELIINENPNEIDTKEIRRILGQLGNCKKMSAYGVLGFICFLEGYYLILVTKRTKCAVVGMHTIYTIKDTVMVRVNQASKQVNPLEQRYLKMFTNIDLKSNFYFSYSYDLTRTLQHNMSAPRFVGDADIEKDEPLPDWGQVSRIMDSEERVVYAFRGTSRKRFIWNAFLLKPMAGVLHRDWTLEVIHGFVSQINVSIFGRPVHISLIARRSTRFAGTRFLKRGSNFNGDVANEVETEQIVFDGHRMCSFTQMRGSIPAHWSQDISKMVPKPPIAVDLSDPYSLTPGKHYQRLLFHFGAPIIILNLVKKREKRPHESILAQEMLNSVKYLNQFVPPQFRIKYIHFDMARKTRGECNVMASLASYAENVIQQTGMFLKDNNQTSFQTGIVRVNCVDCLDRTNTAQFAIGKCALAHQLCKLGFIKPPKLEFDSDCITMLESLYEDHGDTLALQYGGSQLVHRIKTYRKTAAWTSQGNDIMQTLSRYYSNTFSDTEKQHSINLFLGYYIPYKKSEERTPIWELPTDYYMHNLQKWDDQDPQWTVPITQWLRPITLKHLPYSTSDANKIAQELIRVHARDLEMIDYYSAYYIPFRCTTFEENIVFQISQLARNFIPKFRTNFSPFEPAGRRREGRGILQNPSLTGQSSTSSINSSSSSSMDDDSSSDEDTITDNRFSISGEDKEQSKFTFKTFFPSMREVYLTQPKKPEKADTARYKMYVKYGQLSGTAIQSELKESYKERPFLRYLSLEPMESYGNDSYESINLLPIRPESIGIYEKYIRIPKDVCNGPSYKDYKIFEEYANFGCSRKI